ncbi:MAG: hypothetical protein ACK2US_14850 [Anaerolineae bacterium]|jgi:hypothetical protein
MAPLVTHLVVGERVFAQLRQFDPAAYGSFLLGCVLVDVNGFSDIDRRTTHFVGRLHEDGADAFRKSCTNFLAQLDALLVRPWCELTQHEQAFVAGYLCHLAVDEVWKRLGQDVMLALGIDSLADTPVPGEVFMTAFDVASSEMYIDFSSVSSELDAASIPNVLTHVPYAIFQTMWRIVKPHVMDGRTVESYFEMIKRLGRTPSQVQTVRRKHKAYWEDTVTWIAELGGVEPYILNATQRSLEVLPRLWALLA